MLTGINPFNSQIEAEILSNQVTKKLPYDKVIPKKLFKVLLKATEKESVKRYASALEFKDAINEAISRPDQNRLMFGLEEHRGFLVILFSFIIVLLVIITLIAFI